MFVSAIDASGEPVRALARPRRPRPSPSPGLAGSSSCTTSRLEPSFGTRISTSISSGASAVWNTPGEEVESPAIARSPSGPRATSLAVRREDHGRKIRGGIAVCERATDRASMPHLRVADLAGRVGDDRTVLPEQRATRRRPCAVSGRRSRSCRPPRARTRGRRCRPTSIKQRRPRDAELHRRQERVPAGEELRVLPLAEELDRVIGCSATT